MLLMWILNYLNVNVPAESSSIVEFLSSVVVLSVIALTSFIYIISYFMIIFLINTYKIKDKYPKYNRIIYYFESTRLGFIIFETILCTISLVLIITYSIIYINNIIN